MALNQAEKEFFNKLAEEAKAIPQKPLCEMTIEEFREGAKVFQDFVGPGADIDFKDMAIPCEAGHQLKARFYQVDDQVRPLLIFFPGCGYILDLFESNHVAVSKIAKNAGCHAILIQFRLAPEYPFPAAYDDALDATKYIFKHSSYFQADTNKIIVSGFSSGGGLAAAVCHALKGSSDYKIFHQLLMDGFYDFSLSLDSYADFEKEDLLCTPEAIQYLVELCVPDVNQRRDTRWSPYWEKNFHGLPSTTMILPEYSRGRSQNEEYAKRLEGAGVSVNKIVLPGQTHNTAICRKVLTDGDDAAVVAGKALKQVIENV